MNFIDEIFTILQFTNEQRTLALADLDIIIKAEITNQLINQLPDEVKQTGSDFDSSNISELIKLHFSASYIEEVKRGTIGMVLLSYLDQMLTDITAEQQERIKGVFTKYAIALPGLL